MAVTIEIVPATPGPELAEHFREKRLALEFVEIILVMPVLEQGTDVREKR